MPDHVAPETPMADYEPIADFRAWEGHHREFRRRIAWAPLLANGAMVVALVSGAVGADHPAQLLHTFALPLVAFGLGAGVGLASEEFSLWADESIAISAEMFDRQFKESFARRRSSARSGEVTPSVVEDYKRLADEESTAFKRADEAAARGESIGRWALGFRLVSMILCAVGFTALVLVGAI